MDKVFETILLDIDGEMPEVPHLLPSRLIVNKEIIHDDSVRLSEDIFISESRF